MKNKQSCILLTFKFQMQSFFNQYLNVILEYKRLNCEETVACAELNLVMSLCKLLEIFTTKENGIDPKDEENFEDMVKLWFLFRYVGFVNYDFL